MASIDTMRTAPRSGAATRPDATGLSTFRWSPRVRKLWLIAHIVTAVGWLGADIALGALVLSWTMSPDPLVAGASGAAIAVVAGWPIISLAALSLLTGIALGLGTRHRVLRSWWVVVKLALNVVLLALIIAVLVPATLEVQSVAIAALESGVRPAVDSRLFYPPAVSTAALLLAAVLAVVKPWGAVRPDARAPRRERRAVRRERAGGRMAS